MFGESNLRPITRWRDPKSLYSLWLLERPAFPPLTHLSAADNTKADFNESPISIPSELLDSDHIDVDNDRVQPEEHPGARRPCGEAFGTPSLSEYEESWELWDEITLRMVPRDMIFEKPIYLRHIFLFYLGHIPA